MSAERGDAPVEERLDSDVAPFSELAPLAPRAARHAPAGSWAVRAVDRLFASLPAVLMAVLAALTWWLVKNTPGPGDPGSEALPKGAPDYTMQGFAVSHYAPDGSLRARLEGDVLHHYPDTDRIEIEGVRLHAVDEAGRVLTGRALRALSNGEATHVQLLGDARVLREPAPGESAAERVEILGEALEVDREAQRVRSSRAVTLLSGRGSMRAGSLDYDHRSHQLQLGGRVRGELPSGLPGASP